MDPEFFPNKTMRIATAKPAKSSFLGKVSGWLPNNPLLDMIDNMLMKITARRWSRKTIHKKLNSHGIVMGMKTGKHFSKPDPSNFQSKLLAKYVCKVADVLQGYERSLAQ